MSANAFPTAVDRSHPFSASILSRRRLTSASEEKETVHISLDISGSGMNYACGDSLGVFPSHNPALVEALLAALGFEGGEPVRPPQEDAEIPIRAALASHLALRGISEAFLKAVRDRAESPAEKAELAAVLDSGDPRARKEWLDARDALDIARSFPSAKFSPQEYAGLLRKLAPRLYSIASSPAKSPDAIDLTVVAVRYEVGGRTREGVCSNFLARHAAPGERVVPVFLSPSHFTLPADDSAPLIMVGPGTGIAPFRGFLQDRATRGATGKNWLFFGERHEAGDFLYRDEILRWKTDGVLTELSLAWSRDQPQKIYVQDKIRERGAEVWRWLETGAFFRVCGDAKRMAKDVETALLDVVAAHGGKTPEEAREYVAAMRKTGRYQRDVY
jgi:sulfite reductase (NADPH) flavoprotein alpha-component